MKLLLASNAPHVPPRGGSTRSNLVWLEHMATQGHDCRVVAAAAERDSAVKAEQLRRELAEQRIEADAEATAVLQRGVRIYPVTEPSRRAPVLREQATSFQPDWLLVSSEDLGHTLLREAHRSAPGRVIYLAHTPQFYPFGPAAWNPDPHAASLVREAAAVVAIGHRTAAYIERHIGRPAHVIHPPIYGTGPFESFGRFDGELVTMINPCAVKGLPIFLEVAERLPDVAFGALLGWGTTSDDRVALAGLPNVETLGSVPRIEDVLRRTRLLLMPSLWLEGFGLIVVEAMLRGIPVVASDSGGLVEAKLGTRYVLPVRPIERYEPVFDEHHLPRPVLPPQDAGPWVEAVRELLSRRATYEQESEAARRAALAFVSGLRASGLEEFLQSLAPGPEGTVTRPDAPPALSPERRALLLRKLKERR